MEFMRVVDTKGQLCPAPMIAAKRALKESSEGESFLLITDNKTAFENLNRFLNDNKAITQCEESQGVWTFTVTKTTGDVVRAEPEEYCETTVTHFEKGDYVVVISSDKMGEGDDKLGHLLMSTFIKALKDTSKMPGKILFYNSGVKLGINDSPVIADLRDLEKMGVELLFCGTCVNFYSLQEVIGAGTISNMFVMAEIMASAGKVIKP
jgi:selenium metabolism protein YedF